MNLPTKENDSCSEEALYFAGGSSLCMNKRPAILVGYET